MAIMGNINDKLVELKTEMLHIGLWKKQVPCWVREFAETNIQTQQHFAEWLQFVYLPNMMQLDVKSNMGTQIFITPQAVKFFGNDLQKGKLLQLLIELDSLL